MSTTMTTTTTTDNGQIMIRKEHLSLRLGEPKTFFVLILILYTSNILFKFICRWCLGGKSLTDLFLLNLDVLAAIILSFGVILWCPISLNKTLNILFIFLTVEILKNTTEIHLNFLTIAKYWFGKKSSLISDIMKKL